MVVLKFAYLKLIPSVFHCSLRCYANSLSISVLLEAVVLACGVLRRMIRMFLTGFFSRRTHKHLKHSRTMLWNVRFVTSLNTHSN